MADDEVVVPLKGKARSLPEWLAPLPVAAGELPEPIMPTTNTPDTQAKTLPSGRAELLSNDGAAEFLGVTPHTLEVWRCTKRQFIPTSKSASW